MIHSLCLALALYFTATLVVRVLSVHAQKGKGDFTLLAILSALSWGAFHYFS
jgi:hypothetical protein